MPRTNYANLAICIGLAAFTNHSRGELVYSKQTVITAPNISVTSIESSGRSDSEDSIKSDVRVKKIRAEGSRLIALLDGGADNDLPPGALLEAQRRLEGTGSKGDTWIPTAKLKILELKETYSIAEVLSDGSFEALMHFNSMPGLMVGDRVVASDATIEQTLAILPKLNLDYQSLFIDPKGFPATLELSPEGKSLLFEQIRPYLRAKVPLLIVEGHTDLAGAKETNQIESYERALTVRQTLIDELNIDPERILAVGLGESEPLKEAFLPGKDREARRIVIRASSPVTAPR